MELAYTHRNKEVYLKGLVDYGSKFKKLGKRPIGNIDIPEGYAGGCIFKTPQEAENYRLNGIENNYPQIAKENFSVFTVQLNEG